MVANSKRRRQVSKAFDVPMWFVTIVEIALGVLILIATVISLQPWISLAEVIAGQVNVIPYIDVVRITPFVGPLLESFDAVAASAITSTIAVAIAVTVNVVQIVGGLHPENKRIQTFRMIGCVLEIAVAFWHHSPYEGGFPAVVADAPYWDAYQLDIGACIMAILSVFMFETVVNYGALLVKDLKQQAKRK